jgi:hypothetical protein
VKSLEDPNTYLINDTADPLQQSLSGLLLDGLPPTASAAFAPKTGARANACLLHTWDPVALLRVLSMQAPSVPPSRLLFSFWSEAYCFLNAID